MNHTDKNIIMMMKVIRDAHEHISMGTPYRVWSTYFRYALNELEKGYQSISESLKEKPEQRSILEHAIPFNVIRDMLLKIDEITFDRVSEVLKKYHVVCSITHEENIRLGEAGLNSCMPKDWDGENPYARYDAIGLKVTTREIRAAKKSKTVMKRQALIDD